MSRLTGWEAGAGPGAPIVRGRIEGIADIEAIEAVLPQHVLPGRTPYECLQHAAALFPDKPALIALPGNGAAGPARVLSFSQYLAKTTTAANLFRGVSAGTSSVTALMLPILPEALFCAWAGATAGVTVPVNPHLEPALVASILNRAGATVLVTTQAHGASAADRLDEIVAAVPSLRGVYLIEDEIADEPRFVQLAKAMQGQDQSALDFEPVTDPAAEAIYLPTGGTTAAPKLARLTNLGVLLDGWMCGAIGGAAADDVVALAMPLFHVGGLLTLGLRSVVLAQTAVLLSPSGFRDRGVVANFWALIKALSVTTLVSTPTTAAAIYAQPGEDHAGHCLRVFNSGGSTVPTELGRNFERRFGIAIREVWGATEFHGFLACQPNGPPPRIGSVGRRMPWHQVKAVYLDDDNRLLGEAAPGEQGIIIGAGPCLALGYLDSALDRQFFVAMPDEQFWGSTGDLGRVDAEGLVWIDGRAKDLIIRGGHNIDPAMIEEVVGRWPGVVHVAAIGYPDREKGEMPVVYLESIPGSAIDAAALLKHCQEHIAERAACPIAIHVIEQMPLTPVGKIFKPRLREMATLHAATQALRAATADAFEISLQMGARPRIMVSCGQAGDVLRADLSKALAGFSFEFEILPADPQGQWALAEQLATGPASAFAEGENR